MKEFIIKFDTDKPLSELASGTTVMALMKVSGDCDEIIRCKDCKYNPENAMSYLDDDLIEGYIHCGHLGDGGYCSLAKRKEE